MATEATAIVAGATPEHIEAIRSKVDEIKKNISVQFMDLGELLGEIKDGGYHVTWGFLNFGLWLKQSGLDLGESAAYYLIKIVRNAKVLGVPRDELQQVKLSKLREINRLDPKTHSKQMKKLIKACTPDKDGNEMSLEDVRLNVQKVEAGLKEGDDETNIDLFVFMTIKVTTTQKQVIEDAVELVRAKHGDTVDSDGNPVEISIGRAIEFMAAECLNGVDEVEKEDQTVPVENDEQCYTCQTGIHGPRPDDLNQYQEHPGDTEVLEAEIVEEIPISEHPPTVESEAEKALDEAQELVLKAAENPEVVAQLRDMGLKIDVKAVEQRVAADLAVNPDDDPLFEECKKIVEAEFNEDTSPAIGALTFQRRFRIGTARALKLFTDITGVK